MPKQVRPLIRLRRSIASAYTTNSGSARVITRVSAATASRRNFGTANIP